MPTLMDVIKGGISSVPTPGATDETARLQDLMRAKGGRALPGTGSTPRMSNLQEQAANTQATAQAGAQAADAKLAVAGAEASDAAAATKAEGQLASISAGRAAQKQAFKDREASLVQELKQGKQGINLERDKARIEQLGFLSRLTSEKYTTALEQAGAEARLSDEIAYKTATIRAVFNDTVGALEDRLHMDDLLNMDANEFQMMLGTMKLDWAEELAGDGAAAANQAATYTAVGSLATTGVKAGVDYTDYKNKNPDAPKRPQEGDPDFRGPPSK